MNKKQQEFNQQFYNNGQQRAKGETSIHKDAEDGQVNPEVGEYVDFEEIDENPNNKEV